MFVCDEDYECCGYKYWDKEKDIDDTATKTCGHLIEVVPKRYVKVQVKRTGNLDKFFPNLEGNYILDKNTMMLYQPAHMKEFVQDAGYYIEEVE